MRFITHIRPDVYNPCYCVVTEYCFRQSMWASWGLTNTPKVQSTKINISGAGQQEVKSQYIQCFFSLPQSCHLSSKYSFTPDGFWWLGRLLCTVIYHNGCLLHKTLFSLFHWIYKKITKVLLTSWKLWRGKPSKQDSSALYQCQQDTPHGGRAKHGYRSIYGQTKGINWLKSHKTFISALKRYIQQDWDGTVC